MPNPPTYGHAIDGVIQYTAPASYYDALGDDRRNSWTKLPSGVGVGATQVDGKWTNPPEPPAAPTPASAFVDDVPTFFNRFAPAEEAAIRKLAKGDADVDPPVPVDVVAEVFIRRLDDPRTLRVNRALDTVKGGIAYFAGVDVPGLGKLDDALVVLELERVEQILAPDPY